MTNRLALVVSSMAALLLVTACETPPTAPTNIKVFTPPGSNPAVSGHIYVHSAAGVTAAANYRFFGWLEGSTGGSTTGALRTGADGSYVIDSIGSYTTVRVNAMSGDLYQPCAATVSPHGTGVTQDVRLVSDPAQLGANLPEALMSQGPLMTGQVFDMSSGSRQPVANAYIELDGLWGLGLVIANTQTDGDGRFVLCSVPYAPSLYLFASKNGFELFERGDLVGVSNLDIELRAK